jgi:hypothetical protein
MRTRTVLFYATPLVSILLLNTMPPCFGADSDRIRSQSEEQFKQKYVQHEQEDLDQALSHANKLVDAIVQRADEAIASVPKLLYSSPELTATNADYDAIVRDIHKCERARIKDVYNQLTKQEELIKEGYAQEIYGFSNSNSGLKATALKLATAKQNRVN